MTKALVCWKCGASLKSVSLPLGHYDLCPICREELHVCMMCRSYDPAISGKCRKEEADYVGNKEQANYCHYFLPRANAYKSRVKSKAEQAREELSALFGQAGSDTSRSQDYDANAKQARSELGALFGDAIAQTEDALSPEEKARRELEKLFANGSD